MGRPPGAHGRWQPRPRIRLPQPQQMRHLLPLSPLKPSQLRHLLQRPAQTLPIHNPTWVKTALTLYFPAYFVSINL